jgi:hypothetical protein
LFCEVYNNHEQDVNELVPHETMHAINADARTILSGKFLKAGHGNQIEAPKKHRGLGLDKKS